jgi:hypothetical protein
MTDRLDYELRAIEADNYAETAIGSLLRTAGVTLPADTGCSRISLLLRRPPGSGTVMSVSIRQTHEILLLVLTLSVVMERRIAPLRRFSGRRAATGLTRVDGASAFRARHQPAGGWLSRSSHLELLECRVF